MADMSNLKYRVLIVDNSSDTKQSLEDFLDDGEFMFEQEFSADKGYKRIQKQHYDLIVTEIQLGEEQMTGLEMLQKVREGNSTVPFVILTDQSSVENSVMAINYGVAGYLVKPLVPSEVSETIRRAIRYHKGRFLKSELENYNMENAFHAVIASEERSILKLLDTVDNLIELVYPNDTGGFSDLKMAIYESLSNAVEHGNSNQPDKNIFFKLNLRMDRITVHIKDEGTGFNAHKMLNQRDTLKGLNRGLNLIYHLMDEISFNTMGNEINLLKIL
ncbi:MAG: response regulator [Deltaproteobacteria bacterium]|jgi:DNA-binding response OmpR family regulator/anti-sigma regulatory factor (Ser/Thr protein kinase)|nr:response regulator [Deltaproteobacteria bacterium]MBT6500966.1 response regulator [Deltaproteobacteria bacterium]MBT6610692.1 response regulator [Deltaproteobacteria bacterium]MBT7152172.1 response regulator [Deltaproteobacteria bacterium]MBT7889754.1 response regulator [Deltaproteobacteria bacterium]